MELKDRHIVVTGGAGGIGRALARRFAAVFAGTALRPPLPLALDLLVEGFSLGSLDVA